MMHSQSQKSTPLPPSIAGIFALSLLYWLYLAFHTQMQISCDAIGYQELGRLLQNHGFLAYLKTGPNREPLYPLLINASMQMEALTGFSYVKIMAIFGVIILFLSQLLTYKILRLLNIRNGVCVLILAYLAMSPALNNAAFSLYSEISALPVTLGIILASFYTWEAISLNKHQRAYLCGGLLGLLLTAATLIKAVFECITPLYFIIFFVTVFLTDKETKTKKRSVLLISMLAAISLYYIPVTCYKLANKEYNEHFAITDRGSWALYGSTARRMEPLSLKKFSEALAYVPGEGVCKSLFGPIECDFWSFRKSDELGFAKQDELSQRLDPQKLNAALLVLSAQKAIHNPFQYILLTSLEGLKMFFWESTQVGFVSYPHWLQKIYNIKLLNNGLRFLMSLLAFWAVFSLWIGAKAPSQSRIGFLIGVLVFFYILFFSFFFILTRYALPIAPLYLIAVGIWIDKKLALKNNF